MKTTIDSVGRIKPGRPFKAGTGDSGLEVDIAATPMTLKRRGKGVVAIPRAKLPTLTAELVRETLERIRR